MPKAPQNTRDFKALVKVVEDLRGPDGCPWDKEQTHASLTPYAIEEVHELVEAIEQADWAQVQDELGDVLLQVVLHAEVARQDGRFDIYDVIDNLCRKMIRRHPHVFGDVKVASSADVVANWHDIKAAEKPRSKTDEIFDMPRTLPALMRSQKIGAKTKKHRFDWASAAEVFVKVREEFEELQETLTAPDVNRQREELGDLLFSLAQLARHLGFDAEQALRQTNDRFELRFRTMRALVDGDGKDFANLPSAELESYWQRAKEKLKREG